MFKNKKNFKIENILFKSKTIGLICEDLVINFIYDAKRWAFKILIGIFLISNKRKVRFFYKNEV